MESKFATIGTQKIHYLQTGNGERLLIGFHGYGNDASLFKELSKHLQHSFTMLFIDLPFHGQTDWNSDTPVLKEELCEWINYFMNEFSVEKISLIGYSIGGRVCLSIVEEMPKLIDNCVLVAADGLVFNPFYHIVTRNNIGKAVFKYFLSNDKNLRLIKAIHKRRLLDERKYKFIMQYLKTQNERNKLSDRWISLSLLVPNNKKLKSVILKHDIPIAVFMGERDTVIPVAKAKKFAKGLASVQVHILKKGHRMFDSETIPLIAQSLIDK